MTKITHGTSDGFPGIEIDHYPELGDICFSAAYRGEVVELDIGHNWSNRNGFELYTDINLTKDEAKALRDWLITLNL